MPHTFTLRVSILLSTLVALAASSTVALAAPGFGPALSDNGTGEPDGTFVGAPDGNFAGLGAQSLTYSFGDNVIVNRPGAVDLNVYEVDFGGPEFEFLEVLVSTDGVSFSSVKATEATLERITGDEAHDGGVFGRSYDLGALVGVRYVRLVGTGNGAAGGTNYFDLDAIGVHELVASSVPEPHSAALLLAGLCAGGCVWRRRSRNRQVA